MKKEDLMESDEICQILRISPRTLYARTRWRRPNNVPVFKQGRRLFAYRKEFEKWYRGRLIY